MTLIALTQCCRMLAIDGKTLRRWLAEADLPVQAHPLDARAKGLSREHLLLLASTHHRRLPALLEKPSAPTESPSQPSALPAELLTLLQTLSALPAQLAAVQQQLAALAALLRPQPQPSVVVPRRLQHVARRSPPSPSKASTRSPRTAASRTKSPGPSVPVLPLIEYGREGSYVVICPTQGLLTLLPDTPAWFAWLATRSSFRFVGKQGRFTAHREVERLPGAAWRAHRSIRSHTYNLHLGTTESLTIAALEQAAAALQAHLS